MRTRGKCAPLLTGPGGRATAELTNRTTIFRHDFQFFFYFVPTGLYISIQQIISQDPAYLSSSRPTLGPTVDALIAMHTVLYFFLFIFQTVSFRFLRGRKKERKKERAQLSFHLISSRLHSKTGARSRLLLYSVDSQHLVPRLLRRLFIFRDRIISCKHTRPAHANVFLLHSRQLQVALRRFTTKNGSRNTIFS